MSARYPFDPFALPERPDVPFPSPRARRSLEPRPFGQRVRSALQHGFRLGGILLALSFLIFVPSALYELMRVETVAIDGRVYTAAEFVSVLGDFYFGSLIAASALMSLIGSAAYAGRDLETRDAFWVDPAASGKNRGKAAEPHSWRRKVHDV